MAKGYVTASINVTDPESYPTYVKQVLPTIEAFGGRLLARGGQSETHENQPHGDRHVIIEFPSYQAARDWYHSADYSAVKLIRQSASTGAMTIVEGVA